MQVGDTRHAIMGCDPEAVSGFTVTGRAVNPEALFATFDELGGCLLGIKSKLIGHSRTEVITDVTRVVVTRLTTEFVFGNSTYLLAAGLVEPKWLGAGDRLARSLAIREEMARGLGLEFVLIVHVRKDLDGRLREMLTTKAQHPDNENCDNGVC